MEKLNEQLKSVLTNSFKTLENFYHYLEFQKDCNETSEIIEKMEQLSLEDDELLRYDFLSKMYYSFVMSIDSKEDCYHKYKFRYFLYKWQDDKDEANCELSIDFRNVGISTERIIASFALYTSIFSSNNKSIKILKSIEGLNSKITPQILTMVHDSDYLGLLSKIGDLWYYPALKSNSTEISILKSLNQKNNMDPNSVEEFPTCVTSLSETCELVTPSSSTNTDEIFSLRECNDTNFEGALMSVDMNNVNPRSSQSTPKKKFKVVIDNSLIYLESEVEPSTIQLSGVPIDSAFVSQSVINPDRLRSTNGSQTVSNVSLSASAVNNISQRPVKQKQATYICSPMLKKHSVTTPHVQRSQVNNNSFSYDGNNLSMSIEDLRKLKNEVKMKGLRLDCETEGDVVDSLLNSSKSLSTSSSKSLDLVYGKYKCERLLGEGGSSKVYEAFNQKDKKKYALKIMFFTDMESKKMVEDEIEILKIMCNSNRSIFLKESCVGTKGAVIIMERAITDLKVFFAENKKIVNPVFILHYWHQMMLCVKAIHDRRICHMDLKLQNFVITDTLRVKIIDYGISRRLSPNVSVIQENITMGTVIFMSPEMLRGESEINPKKCDIWAMGIVLYSLVYDSQPHFISSRGFFFSASTVQEYMNLVLSSPEKKFFFPMNRGHQTPRLKSLMDMCLEESVKERANANKIIDAITMIMS